MVVSSKTDLRFPESGQQGHGARIIHPDKLPTANTATKITVTIFFLMCSSFIFSYFCSKEIEIYYASYSIAANTSLYGVSLVFVLPHWVYVPFKPVLNGFTTLYLQYFVELFKNANPS